MEHCKSCGSKKLVKNGKGPESGQSYKCKECRKTYRSGDLRLKHDLDKRLKVIKMRWYSLYREIRTGF